jgi:hypothetical protein
MREDKPQPRPEAFVADRSNEITTYFATIGLIISLLAFSLSVTTPWVAGYLSPPQAAISLEDMAVETALNIKDKLILGLKGKEYKAPPPPPKEATLMDAYPLVIILASLAGIFLGAWGLIKKENLRIAVGAMVMGVGAIVAFYMLVFAAILVLVLLVGSVLGTIGIDI